ncbi:MAG: hypothetical protein RLZZ361_1464 [Cyanobacteriota bacterium]|jgi:GNAT superfamily N-acetyltransferase
MFEIQQARVEHSTLILKFIKDLAEYEKLSHKVYADIDSIKASFFCKNPKVFCLIAYWDSLPVGFAVYFYNYSTFLAKHGLYLEDLFIDPLFRSRGFGKQIFKALVAIAKKEGLGRIDWWVLNWNTPAIDFYKSLKAQSMDDWTVYRITEDDFDFVLNS